MSKRQREEEEEDYGHDDNNVLSNETDQSTHSRQLIVPKKRMKTTIKNQVATTVRHVLSSNIMNQPNRLANLNHINDVRKPVSSPWLFSSIQPTSSHSIQFNFQDTQQPQKQPSVPTVNFQKPELFNQIADYIDMDEQSKNKALEWLFSLHEKKEPLTSINVVICLIIGVIHSAQKDEAISVTCRRIIRIVLASRKSLQQETFPSSAQYLKFNIISIASDTVHILHKFTDPSLSSPEQEQHIMQVLQKVVDTIKKTASLYDFFSGLYEALFQRLEPDKGGQELFNNSILKYAWLLVIYFHDFLEMNSNEWDLDHSKSLCFAAIYFIALNTPNIRRKTSQVLLSLGFIQRDQIHDALHVDWKCHWDNILPLLAAKEKCFHPDLLRMAFHHAANACKKMEEVNCLKHTDKNMDSSGLPIYLGSFDENCQAFLQSNITGLNQKIDQFLYNKSYPMDPRIYLPDTLVLGSRPSRGLLKTPRPSASAKVTSRNLGEALQKASYYNNLMASTPITAKSTLVKRSKGVVEDNRTAKEKLSSIVATEYLHPAKYINHLTAYSKDPHVQEEIRKSIEVCTLDVNLFIEKWSAQGPDYRAFAEQTLRLYHRVLMTVIDSECSRFRKVSIPMLLSDKSFRHCLLACSGELIRHVFEVNLFTFEHVLSSLNINKLELVMMIDLILKGLGGWLPKLAIKRLAGISERIIEMEIWNEPTYLNLMQAVKTNKSIATTPVYLLYDEVNMAAQMYSKTTNIEELHKCHIPRLAKLLRDKMTRLHSMRLAELCQALNCTEKDFMRSKLLFESLMDRELELGLFRKRNVDAIMLCCLFFNLKYGEKDITMEQLTLCYSKQPQFVDDYVINIFISPTEKPACLMTFYNKVFLPTAKPIFQELLTSLENRPELLTPMRKRMISYKEPNQPLATPLTRRLMTNQSTLRIPMMRSIPTNNPSLSRKLRPTPQ